MKKILKAADNLRKEIVQQILRKIHRTLYIQYDEHKGHVLFYETKNERHIFGILMPDNTITKPTINFGRGKHEKITKYNSDY